MADIDNNNNNNNHSHKVTPFFNTFVQDHEKFGYGTRLGSFYKHNAKIFSPGTSGINGEPGRMFVYNRDVVPSIDASEKMYSMFSQGGYPRRDFINTQAGDNNYFDLLLQHYDRVPKSYMDSVGLRYYRGSAETYGNTTTVHRAVSPPYEGSFFESGLYSTPPYAGKHSIIHIQPPKYINMGPRRNWYLYGVDSNTREALRDTTRKGFAGGTVGHEFTHESKLPEVLEVHRNYDPLRGNKFYIKSVQQPRLVEMTIRNRYNKPYGDGHATGTLMIYDNNKHKDWYEDEKVPSTIPSTLYNRLDPYDTDDVETAQAIISYNRSRNNLKNNIRNNRLQYMVRGFNPMHLKMVEMQPQFYTSDEAGKRQFNNDMAFYRDNPQMAELLGTEGRRAVATWHNLDREANRVFSPQMGPLDQEYYVDLLGDRYDYSPLATHQRRLNAKLTAQGRRLGGSSANTKQYNKNMRDMAYINRELNKYRKADIKGNIPRLLQHHYNDSAKKLKDRFSDFRILGNNRDVLRPQYSNATGTAIG